MPKSIKIVLDIIKPSALGLVSYFIIFLAIVISYQKSVYYKAISNLQVSDFKGTIFYNSIIDFNKFIHLQVVNTVMFYAFWVITASAIYFIAARLVANANDMAVGLMMRHYIWPKGSDKNRPLREILERIIFHLAILILLIIYLIKVPPRIVHWLQVHQILNTLSGKSLETGIILFVYIFLFLHVLIILLRLLFTRRRLI